jgi:hypothetical protein
MESQKKATESTEAKTTIELRCPKECGCAPRGKLLATVFDVPLSLRGAGVVIQLACPAKKSRLHRIAL